jgi:hypothetical protein
MAKHEFRFVVDGVDLSDAQRIQIGEAIQKAGLGALESVQARMVNPVMVGHINPKLRPEWIGIWVIDGPFGDEIGNKINDIGFFLR